MANTNPSWEVVVKSKKAKGTNQNLTKTQKKQFVANMPRIEQIGPVKESSTIYDAFVAKEEQRLAKKQQEMFADKIESGRDLPNGKGISDSSSKKKAVASRNKKTEQVIRRRPYSEVAKEVLEEDLKSVLLQSKGHFPDKPDLWLKDLVTYLNMKLENAVPADHYLSFDNKDYLLSSLKKGCVKVISSVISESSGATLEHVMYFCVVTMLEESQNGASTYGFKIFLQLIARANPDVVIAKLPQYKEIVKSTLNRPDRCLSVLWGLSQVSHASLKAALRVWLEIMFPHLSLRSVSGFCMQYLENILSKPSDLTKASGAITLREYFHILDNVYGTFLSQDIRKKLLSSYPLLKTLAHGRSTETTLRNFFPSYLTRANLDSPSALHTEVMSCLLECLSKDKHTFSLWCQLYLKHLTQSRLLMQHLADNWENLSGSLDKKMLQQTLMTFMRTNEEMSQGRNSGEWGQMTLVCEELLKKMTRPRFPWRLLMFCLVAMVLGIVAYDIFSSKSLKESRTVGFLETYGIMGLIRQIVETITLYGFQIYGWLKVNVPMYTELIYTTVFPYVVRVVNFCCHLEEYTREHRRQVTESVYNFAPEFWNAVGLYMSLIGDFILQYSVWIKEHVFQLWYQSKHWWNTKIVQGEFSSNDIQETLQWSAIKVQNFTASLVHWCKNLLS